MSTTIASTASIRALSPKVLKKTRNSFSWRL